MLGENYRTRMVRSDAVMYYFLTVVSGLSRETRKQNNFLTNYIFVPTNKKYIIF